jgi:ADP-ribosylglycohydrolase
MAPATKDRVLACFHGIAIGDAVGKQTENLTRDDVLRWYPNGSMDSKGHWAQ